MFSTGVSSARQLCDRWSRSLSYIIRQNLLLIAWLTFFVCPAAAQQKMTFTEPFEIGGKVFDPKEMVVRGPDGKPAANPQLAAELREAVVADYAERLGISKSSKFYDRLKNSLAGSGPLVLSSPSDTAHPESVIIHLRSTEGSLLPTQKDIEAHPLITNEEIDKRVAEYIDSVKDATIDEKDLAAPKLDDCPYAKTSSYVPEPDPNGRTAPEFDFLFVSDGRDWSDSAKYGATMTLMKFKMGEFSPEGFVAKEMAVRCLPTRIRYKKGVMYWHEGGDALKNFDLGKNGAPVKEPLKRMMPD